MIKICIDCGIEYPARTNSLRCRKCYMKHYWKENPELRKERTKRNLKTYRKNRQFVLDYKHNQHCEHCGYCEHTEILQFHHKDRETKWHSIANSITHLSRENMLKEIDKCILLCPNCHYWLHYSKA